MPRAVDTIKHEFKSDWSGCTLREIYYAGDNSIEPHQDWADRNDADEVIVLLSSFDVDSSGGDGSLNPDSTYSDWKWILVRSDGGKWKSYLFIDNGRRKRFIFLFWISVMEEEPNRYYT